MSPRPIALAASLVLLIAGCGRSSAQPAASDKAPPFTLGTATGAARFDATVEEVIEVRGYVYLRVADREGDQRWLASLHKPFSVGDTVAVTALAERSAFFSKQLSRTFDSLLFAVVRTSDRADPQQAVPAT